MKTLQPQPNALQDYIRRVPLFAGCSPADMERLLPATRLLSCERGEHVFKAGDTPSCLYVLLSGSAQVYRIQPDGSQKNLHLFHALTLLGEAAVFTGIPYPSSCVVNEDSLLLCFSREKLMHIAQNDPTFSWRLIGQMYKKLNEFASQLAMHSQKNALMRVASYLLGLAQAQPHFQGVVELPAPKKDIANYLGLRPESLSRAFAQLERDGILKVESQTISILHIDRLERFLEEPEEGDAS